MSTVDSLLVIKASDLGSGQPWTPKVHKTLNADRTLRYVISNLAEVALCSEQAATATAVGQSDTSSNANEVLLATTLDEWKPLLELAAKNEHPIAGAPADATDDRSTLLDNMLAGLVLPSAIWGPLALAFQHAAAELIDDKFKIVPIGFVPSDMAWGLESLSLHLMWRDRSAGVPGAFNLCGQACNPLYVVATLESGKEKPVVSIVKSVHKKPPNPKKPNVCIAYAIRAVPTGAYDLSYKPEMERAKASGKSPWALDAIGKGLSAISPDALSQKQRRMLQTQSHKLMRINRHLLCGGSGAVIGITATGSATAAKSKADTVAAVSAAQLKTDAVAAVSAAELKTEAVAALSAPKAKAAAETAAVESAAKAKSAAKSVHKDAVDDATKTAASGTTTTLLDGSERESVKRKDPPDDNVSPKRPKSDNGNVGSVSLSSTGNDKPLTLPLCNGKKFQKELVAFHDPAMGTKFNEKTLESPFGTKSRSIWLRHPFFLGVAQLKRTAQSILFLHVPCGLRRVQRVKTTRFLMLVHMFKSDELTVLHGTGTRKEDAAIDRTGGSLFQFRTTVDDNRKLEAFALQYMTNGNSVIVEAWSEAVTAACAASVNANATDHAAVQKAVDNPAAQKSDNAVYTILDTTRTSCGLVGGAIDTDQKYLIAADKCGIGALKRLVDVSLLKVGDDWKEIEEMVGATRGIFKPLAEQAVANVTKTGIKLGRYIRIFSHNLLSRPYSLNFIAPMLAGLSGRATNFPLVCVITNPDSLTPVGNDGQPTAGAKQSNVVVCMFGSGGTSMAASGSVSNAVRILGDLTVALGADGSGSGQHQDVMSQLLKTHSILYVDRDGTLFYGNRIAGGGTNPHDK
jgi:hypothetical protein